ncbi:hypothetical protein OPV22_032216 [Ensete ventricosum]|uniref:Uncharacterized protein n=1 Tax=Ensete ventricosum TaxID=4639 RepID=A0AAV8PP33_ENSVE|nr:hypothetical protein OPV22_032216 [Ensete ventricosum]
MVLRGKSALISILLATLTVSMSMEAVSAAKEALDVVSMQYMELTPKRKTGQERFFCLARGRCRFKTD